MRKPVIEFYIWAVTSILLWQMKKTSYVYTYQYREHKIEWVLKITTIGLIFHIFKQSCASKIPKVDPIFQFFYLYFPIKKIKRNTYVRMYSKKLSFLFPLTSYVL